LSDLRKGAPARAPAQERALRAYVGNGHSRVDGWLEPLALRSILLLDRLQWERGVEGGLCEIGVHRGRLLILLHLLSRMNERTVGFDLFEFMPEDIRAVYGANSRAEVVAAIASHGCDPERIELVTVDSTRLKAEDILHYTRERIRMFSIDGGHDAETALGDLRLAARVLIPGGLVLLDDIFNEQWPGVIEAAARFLQERGHGLVPFCYAGNKMYLATGREAADWYRERMGTALTDVSTKTESFFSHPVLIAWPSAMSPRAKAISLVLGKSALQYFRRSKLLSAMRRRPRT
jgi:Methyltransferase domain